MNESQPAIMSTENRIREHLVFIYGEKEAQTLFPEILDRLNWFRRSFQKGVFPYTDQLTERDVILITYADQISEPSRPPLQSLLKFLNVYLGDLISGVHLLPFYPYSSDDGFSVINYREVNPSLGTWQDVEQIARRYRLMVDAVINHISQHSDWFQSYLRGETPFTNYFIALEPDTNLNDVVRPRATPLLTPFQTGEGLRHVWTTFSPDQVDLNYANPRVLLEMVDLLLFYVERGASIIRLDAIAYLWKELGTPCIHLPQTHRIVKLFRAVLDAVAPWVILITETNVPHEENISYFGEPITDIEVGDRSLRGDEAQMVYQFPLAPLVLHTFLTGNTQILSRWVNSLTTPYPNTAFFNFIASHDGIGVRPAEGLLTEGQIQALVDRSLAHGGQVSYMLDNDGSSRRVYELNITLFDMLNDPARPQPELDVQRFLASQAIMLSLAGVPGIYIHSLFGSRNCYSCVEKTGRARSINREKFNWHYLENVLADSSSVTAQVFNGYVRLLRLRRAHSAFHPQGAQRILALSDQIFAVMRSDTQGEENILCLVNVTGNAQALSINLRKWRLPDSQEWQDLLTGPTYQVANGSIALNLDPYQAMWLRAG